jgi:hypothetical protein
MMESIKQYELTRWSFYYFSSHEDLDAVRQILDVAEQATLPHVLFNRPQLKYEYVWSKFLPTKISDAGCRGHSDANRPIRNDLGRRLRCELPTRHSHFSDRH